MIEQHTSDDARSVSFGAVQVDRPDIETSSPRYARRFEGEAGEYFLETQERLAGELVDQLPAGYVRALDVGGGHAQLLSLYLRHSFDVTVQGSDQSCRDRIRPFEESHPESVRFIESRIPGTLPFRDQSFELVSAIRLLAHIEDWQPFVHELCRVSSEAVLIDYAPLFGWNILSPAMFGVKRLVEKDTRPYLCHWDYAIRSAFAKCNFEVIDTRKQFALPMGLHRAVSNFEFSKKSESFLRTIKLTSAIGSPALLLARRKQL